MSFSKDQVIFAGDLTSTNFLPMLSKSNRWGCGTVKVKSWKGMVIMHIGTPNPAAASSLQIGGRGIKPFLQQSAWKSVWISLSCRLCSFGVELHWPDLNWASGCQFPLRKSEEIWRGLRGRVWGESSTGTWCHRASSWNLLLPPGQLISVFWRPFIIQGEHQALPGGPQP